ncbi:gliding motility-associated-like protein [Neolewinella xylanilytica]|uniref:Gliding motility-associated-like protein n=1 Tax=Neolewinella xylanilytica TaxID=1514080 RepID=A0A2S6I5L0_9BACT|nr:gliding motility-associated C-terminal domain-containing protein [Neolewinella xylanilytica]PPK86442.1 gliding motility-associated-like protein [Neolewinella xylanilytica]
MIQKQLLAFLALIFSVSGIGAQSPCGTLTITNGDEVAICSGQTVELSVTTDIDNPTYSWSPASALVDPATDPSPRVRPTSSGFIRVRATGSNGCSVVDSVYFDVDRLVVPELIENTTVCEGTPIDLLQTPVTDVGNTIYTLRGGDSLLAVTDDPNFTFTLFKDTIFTLLARSENGECEVEQVVNINVTPARFDVQQDTVLACLGTDSITLSVATSATSVTWRPARFTGASTRGSSIRVLPTADITYYAEATINGCPRIDSVAVRLDSLPQDLSMMLEPEKDPYCQGDTFYVLSPVYDVGDFPLITHEWSPAPGLQSPDDLYNAVFIGQDTAELVRTTTNGACVDTTSITVNVVEPPVVTFEPANPVVCPGQELQITATFQSGEGTLSWEDPLGTLSCTDCLNPIATVQETTQYTIQTETDASDCSSELTYTIEVVPNLEPQLTEATLLCPGDTRQLIVGGVVPTYTYRITGGGIDVSDPATFVTPTETTTYTIETTSECGVSEQTIQLVLATDYTVEATAPTTVCAGQPLTLTAAVTPSEITGTYVWTLPSGVNQSGQRISVDDPAPGVYTVTFTDALGCTTATDTVTVEILGADLDPQVLITLPDGTVVPNGGSVFAGGSVTLEASVPGDLNFSYSWSGNYDPSSANGQTITVDIPRADGAPEPLSYTVTLTSEQGGCVFEATVFLNVEQSRVEVPDFFSPDSDGRNDRFRLFYNGTITDYTMIVYDRWGQKVFTSDDPQEGWDGTKDGTPQPADVYLYLAKFRQDGVELQEDGEVTLVR